MGAFCSAVSEFERLAKPLFDLCYFLAASCGLALFYMGNSLCSISCDVLFSPLTHLRLAPARSFVSETFARERDVPLSGLPEAVWPLL